MKLFNNRNYFISYSLYDTCVSSTSYLSTFLVNHVYCHKGPVWFFPIVNIAINKTRELVIKSLILVLSDSWKENITQKRSNKSKIRKQLTRKTITSIVLTVCPRKDGDIMITEKSDVGYDHKVSSKEGFNNVKSM